MLVLEPTRRIVLLVGGAFGHWEERSGCVLPGTFLSAKRGELFRGEMFLCNGEFCSGTKESVLVLLAIIGLPLGVRGSKGFFLSPIIPEG